MYITLDRDGNGKAKGGRLLTGWNLELAAVRTAAEDCSQGSWGDGQRDKQCANHEISHGLRSDPLFWMRALSGAHGQINQQVGYPRESEIGNSRMVGAGVVPWSSPQGDRCAVGRSVQAGVKGEGWGPACTETNAMRSGGCTALRRSGKMRLVLVAALRPGSNNCRTGNHDYEDESNQCNLHLRLLGESLMRGPCTLSWSMIWAQVTFRFPIIGNRICVTNLRRLERKSTKKCDKLVEICPSNVVTTLPRKLYKFGFSTVIFGRSITWVIWRWSAEGLGRLRTLSEIFPWGLIDGRAWGGRAIWDQAACSEPSCELPRRSPFFADSAYGADSSVCAARLSAEARTANCPVARFGSLASMASLTPGMTTAA